MTARPRARNKGRAWGPDIVARDGSAFAYLRMQPIDLNHCLAGARWFSLGAMDEPEKIKLAELTTAVLDPPTLQALVDDLTSLTRICSIVTKSGPTARASGDPWTLAEAVQALRRGELRGVQVHYWWDDQEWIDTLLSGSTGITLVRSPSVAPQENR